MPRIFIHSNVANSASRKSHVTVMIEFTTQNVVTILCPVVHQSMTVKDLQMLLFVRSALILH